MRISLEVRSCPPVFLPRFGRLTGVFLCPQILKDAVMFNWQITNLKSIVRSEFLRGGDYLRMP